MREEEEEAAANKCTTSYHFLLFLCGADDARVGSAGAEVEVEQGDGVLRKQNLDGGAGPM